MLIREQYFAQHYPGVRFIIAKRKKPYPDGINNIIALSKLQPKQIVMVDDRLLTGILAAITTGVLPCWITKPYQNFVARPIRELFFHGLRCLERWLVNR